jgi:hypothetical protein
MEIEKRSTSKIWIAFNQYTIRVVLWTSVVWYETLNIFYYSIFSMDIKQFGTEHISTAELVWQISNDARNQVRTTKGHWGLGRISEHSLLYSGSPNLFSVLMHIMTNFYSFYIYLFLETNIHVLPSRDVNTSATEWLHVRVIKNFLFVNTILIFFFSHLSSCQWTYEHKSAPGVQFCSLQGWGLGENIVWVVQEH